MRSRGSIVTRLGALGLAVTVVGAALLGAAVVAGAAGTSSGCASACSLSATSTTGLAPGVAVQVTGSGFTPKATGGIMLCNLDASQPTIAVPDAPGEFSNLGQIPVGCTAPNLAVAKVSKQGTIFGGPPVRTGTVGPPVIGTDSGGGDATTDAASYPCPPTEDQVNAGVSCGFVYKDSAGEIASVTVAFTTPFTTTTTTAAPSCVGSPATNTGGPPTVTVTPGTCLSANQVVAVTGTGLKASSLGAVLECNTDPSEPTIVDAAAEGEKIPVGCTNPLSKIASTDASGNLASTNFTIETGTIGPPTTGTDSSGGDATTDAASYPCPPTAAQTAAGVTCAVVYGDEGGDQVVVPIGFGANPGTSSNGSGGSSSSGGAKAATAASTKTSSGSLAFTGAGPGLTVLAVVAGALVVLGLVLLAVVDGPRLLWAAVSVRRRSRVTPQGR